jgi:hypothetical protein
MEKILFREHRGGLQEAMKTVQEVSCLEDIEKIKNIPDEFKGKLRIEHYCYDRRIDWDTYIIDIEDYGVVGVC